MQSRIDSLKNITLSDEDDLRRRMGMSPVQMMSNRNKVDAMITSQASQPVQAQQLSSSQQRSRDQDKLRASPFASSMKMRPPGY